MIDLDELEALAHQARTYVGGEWTAEQRDAEHIPDDEIEWRVIAGEHDTEIAAVPDFSEFGLSITRNVAEYIAAASPEVVLELIRIARKEVPR